jgi:hypothetical protein
MNIAVIPALAFTGTVAYAVIGNAAVYVILVRRKVPVRFLWAGTPGYLYGVCCRAAPTIPRILRIFALSTNIAVLLAIPSWIWLAIAHQQQ